MVSMQSLSKLYYINLIFSFAQILGKLIYVLQDAVSSDISNHLGFSCKGPIQTVYGFLQQRNALALLDDPHIEIATQEVLALRKTRAKIAGEIKRKEKVRIY